jgi:hypothetical protein
MKILLLVAAAVLICAILFLAGVFFPRRSRQLQGDVDRVTRKGEEKADRKGGRLGSMTRSALDLVRKAANRSAEKGRQAR